MHQLNKIIKAFFICLLSGIFALSAIGQQQNDSIQFVPGSIHVPYDSLILQADSFFTPASIDTVVTDSSLEAHFDTLVLNWPDTISHAIDYLERKILKKDSLMADTFVYHLEKLIAYYRSRPIPPSLRYVSSAIRKDSSRPFALDTTGNVTADSTRLAIWGLIQYLEKDSIYLQFTSNAKDTLGLWANQDQDSIRLKIFDQLGVPAWVWVKDLDQKSLKLRLDKHTLINKPEAQIGKKAYVRPAQVKNNIRPARDVNIVLPQWKVDGMGMLHFNQAYYHQWVDGGEPSISMISDLKFNADYTKGNVKWDNDFEFKYGILTNTRGDLRKTEDRFEINSQYGRKAFDSWYYSSLVNFRTQVDEGYNYPNDSVPVSDFLAPAYLTFSLGMDYKPGNNLTVMISPITSKYTYVRDTSVVDQTTHGLDENEKLRKELGAYLKSKFKWKISKNIEILNKINLFTNYMDNPENVDVDWEVNINARISDYITANLNTQLIYDDDKDIPVYEVVDGERKQVDKTKGGQFKEVLSVGFSYRF